MDFEQTRLLQFPSRWHHLRANVSHSACPKQCSKTHTQKEPQNYTGFQANKTKTKIDFRIAALAYRHFNNTLPSYLSARPSAYTPSRSLRSCSAQLLCAPRVNLKAAGERSVRFEAPRVWNSLTVEICQSPSLSSFKTNLKTFLFKQAFTIWVQ